MSKATAPLKLTLGACVCVVTMIVLVVLSAGPGMASEGCVVASCEDTDAQLHEGTCLSRCDCIWDSEGTPKSKKNPSCQARPDTDELHATSYQGLFDVYLANEKGEFKMCEDGTSKCGSSSYVDPRCTTKDGATPAEADWAKVALPQPGASNGFKTSEWILVDDPPNPKSGKSARIGNNKVPQSEVKGKWGKGEGWTRCASENVRYLQQDDCPEGYCAREGNASKAPWACCNKCPGGNGQCMVHSCACRCTKDCAQPIRTPVAGSNICSCGADGTVARIGNGDSWSEPKSMPGIFPCNAATFGLKSLPAGVGPKQAHCECDNSIAVTEKAGAGEGYSQCSQWAMRNARGAHAVYKGSGASAIPANIENYHFKVDLRVSTLRESTHGSTGVVFRYQDEKNYYRLVISSYCTTLVRVKGGVQERLMTRYGSTGGGIPKGTSKRESEWVTVGVAVESNDITITIDYAYDEEYNECEQDDPKKCQNDPNSHKGRGTILRLQKEENPVKAIINGRFGFYSSRSVGSLWRNLRYTKQLCSHVRSFLVPDRDVDDWEVVSVHSKKITAGTIGALMVATTSGFYSRDTWRCTTTNPNAGAGSNSIPWYSKQYDISGKPGWSSAVIIDTSKKGVGKKIMHPHDIVGSADWIWADKLGKADEVWCRGERGTEAAEWRGHNYFIERPQKNWASAELACIGLGPGCHLASIHGADENEMVLNMARSVLGKHTSVWIGLNDLDVEGQYVYSDASETDWYRWAPGEPNDFNNNEDCTEMNTWNGEWNDNACNKRVIPSVCKCPIPDNTPEDPSDSSDLPDNPQDVDGDDEDEDDSEDTDDSSEICVMFQGGNGGSAESWFNTPAKKYGSSSLCSVFDSRSACCSADWAFENVFWDYMALLEDINDSNTACRDAIEALRCVVCSPRQAHFMKYSQTPKGPQWEIDVCLPTALATFEFCHHEKDLFPKNSGGLDRFADDPIKMLTNLLTRDTKSVHIWDDDNDYDKEDSTDDYDPDTGASKSGHSPTVRVVPRVKNCFLHDRAAPTMNGALASNEEDDIKIVISFNEPLDENSLRGKILSLQPDMMNTSTRGGSTNQDAMADEAALVRIYKCNTADCVKQVKTSTPEGTVEVGQIEGEIVAMWDDLASGTTSGAVSVKTTSEGLGELHLSMSGQQGKDGSEVLSSEGSTHGYALWIEDGAVFDAAGNAFGGTDLDKDSLIRVDVSTLKKPKPNKPPSGSDWRVVVAVSIVAGLALLAIGVYVIRRRKSKRSAFSNVFGDSDKSSSPMFSSGGFVRIND